MTGEADGQDSPRVDDAMVPSIGRPPSISSAKQRVKSPICSIFSSHSSNGNQQCEALFEIFLYSVYISQNSNVLFPQSNTRAGVVLIYIIDLRLACGADAAHLQWRSFGARRRALAGS